MTKRIIIFLLLLMIIGGAIGTYYYDMAPLSVNDLKTDIEITSQALVAEYEMDEHAANEKYLNKVLEVRGAIVELGAVDVFCTGYLSSDSPISQVTVEFDNCDDFAKLKIGSNVIIKGVCTGYLTDVIINRAIKIN